jgi:hypothetical protein
MTYTQTSLATLRSKAGSLLQKIYTEFGLVKTELDALAAAVDTITRSATIVIAASDSSAKSKAQADYVCDGIDDQVEIQAAIDALPSSGGSILLLEGTFLLDAPHDFYVAGSKYSIAVNKSNLTISGTRGTVLKLKDGINIGEALNLYLVTLNITGNNVLIENIKFDNNCANITADYNIAIWGGTSGTYAQYVDISKNYFENHKRWAIYTDGGGYYWNIHHNTIVPSSVAGGIGFHNGPQFSRIADNIIAAYSESAAKVGVFIDSVNHTVITGNSIKHAEIGIECYDAVKYSMITNNKFTGWRPDSSIGIYLHSKDTEASSNLDNIILDNYIDNFPFGIKINDVYNTDTIIKNNKFRNVTVAVSDSGTRTVIKNNDGWATEKTGTATITAPATTVDVTHGLAAAPTGVLLSPTTATAGKQYYVSAKDATTFTITIDSAAEADISFDWQAVI